MKRKLIIIALIILSSIILLAVIMRQNIGNSKEVKLDSVDFKLIVDESIGKLKATYIGDSSTKGVVRIEKAERTLYSTYVLTADKEELLPFSYGDGEYVITTGRYDNQGSAVVLGESKISIKLDDKLSPFRGTSYYTNYKIDTDKLGINGKSDDEFVDDAFTYVATKIKYNEKLNKLITSGEIEIYRPNLEEIIRTKEGICLDQASLLATILRSHDIPARVVAGYHNSQYHAWVEVWLDSNWKIYDPTLNVTYRDIDINNYETIKYY